MPTPVSMTLPTLTAPYTYSTHYISQSGGSGKTRWERGSAATSTNPPCTKATAPGRLHDPIKEPRLAPRGTNRSASKPANKMISLCHRYHAPEYVKGPDRASKTPRLPRPSSIQASSRLDIAKVAG